MDQVEVCPLILVDAAKTFADWRWGSLGDATLHFIKHRPLLVPGSTTLAKLKEIAASRELPHYDDAKVEADKNAAQIFFEHGILQGIKELKNPQPGVAADPAVPAAGAPTTRSAARRAAAEADAAVNISDDADGQDSDIVEILNSDDSDADRPTVSLNPKSKF